ncbi:MAG: beta-lactamase family protein [Verrucomicrobiota bacterium]|nr:beta-lactamase family protein [Verrucomicrobiota bacterium]
MFLARNAKIVLLLTLFLSALSAAAKTKDFGEIDALIERKMKAHLIPGIAVVIVRGGEVVHSFARGSTDQGPITPDTPFLIGSLSKLFTATLVMQLVDAGLVELDAPVVRYLPEFRTADEAGSRAITVRHLLNQNSGIPGDAPRAENPDRKLQDHVAALGETRLIAPPGGAHVYASPNYQVLGALVERVTGQEFGQRLKDSVFTPLGLTHSFTQESDAVAAGLAPGRNIWFGIAGPSAYRFEPDRLPTASIISSARDLGHFLAAHLGGGQVGETRILSEASARVTHTGVADAGAFKYAMGLRASTTAGVSSLWHGGALPNYRCAVVLLPQENSAVVVLTNVSSIFADHPREIAAAIVASLHGRPLPPPFRPLRQIYFGIAAASLVLVALQIWSLLRAARAQRPAPLLRTLLFDIALPLALVFAIPRFVGMSWRALFESAPDISLVAILLIAIGLTTGALQLWKNKMWIAAQQGAAAEIA